MILLRVDRIRSPNENLAHAVVDQHTSAQQVLDTLTLPPRSRSSSTAGPPNRTSEGTPSDELMLMAQGPVTLAGLIRVDIGDQWIEEMQWPRA
jgi:hypothetical protein